MSLVTAHTGRPRFVTGTTQEGGTTGCLVALRASGPTMLTLHVLLFGQPDLSGQVPLQVCTKLDAGFNMLINPEMQLEDVHSDSLLEGFDVSVRRSVLTRLALPYNITVLPTYAELQVRTRSGECDIGWAPFFQSGNRERCIPDGAVCADLNSSAPWEAKRCCVDFSVEYLDWTMSALSQASIGADFFTIFFAVITEPFMINFTSFLLIWITIFGHLMWVIERSQNADEFPKAYLDGVDDGLWWAAVTVTTVGYGDKSPRSAFGRALAVGWMIGGISMVAILTGHTANRFTEMKGAESIMSVDDLSGSRVCSYAYAFEQGWLQPSTGPLVAVIREQISDCAELLRDGEVDVVVMDTPIMAYYVSSTPWAMADDSLTISHFALSHPPMGFVFPEPATGAQGAELRELINAEMIDFIDSSLDISLQRRWFPNVIGVPEEQYVMWMVILALVLAVAWVALGRIASVSRSVRRQRQFPKAETQLPPAAVTALHELDKFADIAGSVLIGPEKTSKGSLDDTEGDRLMAVEAKIDQLCSQLLTQRVSKSDNSSSVRLSATKVVVMEPGNPEPTPVVTADTACV